jgi:TatD DNase family protein
MRKNRHSLIDTHAHLTFSDYDADRKEVIKRAFDSGLWGIVIVGAGGGIAENKKALELAATSAKLFATVGIHPHDASMLNDQTMGELREMLGHKKVVALGEIGLDYFHKHSEPEVQREAFVKLLGLADEFDKPIVIHSRDAHDDVWRIMEERGFPKRRGVFHCFSGDAAFAAKVIRAGFYISIPGIVTFSNARTLREVAATAPLERMVLETDSPYLSPEPSRGKRNEPSNVKNVAECIADLKGLLPDDVARVTTLNAKRLFGLPGSDLMPDIAYQIRNSLYLNITNSCNLSCKFCPKFVDYEVKGYYLRLDHEPDVDEVFKAVGNPSDYDEVVFCGYGEPTKRFELLKLIAKTMKEKGAKKVRLNTDGLANLLYGRNVLPELGGIIDSISISLNAPDSDCYSKICPSKFGAGAYRAVCEFILEAKKHIPEVAVSVVTLPDMDVDACEAKANELGVPLRLREYMNVG